MPDKSNYQELHEKVQNVINDLDPMGLISGGAPGDEYNSEINQVMGLLHRHRDVDTLAKNIYRIFVKSLNLEQREKRVFTYK